MSPFDWKGVKRDKDTLHQRSASRSYGEKLTVLDRLRERAQNLRQSDGRSKDAAANQHTSGAVRKKK